MQIVRLNGTTHQCACRGRLLAARHVPNTTCVVERYHLSTCHPDRNEMEWRDLLKLQALPYAGYFCCLGRFLHSADATVGMTYVFALIVADTNVPQFWLTPDGGRLPPLHRIRPLWYRLIETAQRLKRGGRHSSHPYMPSICGAVYPHRL